ncbi:hypothetical protein [Leucobacter triazinivorans]|uniref:hypothetical protein n=1 Tax=Leucobacter triazinivorans TaxID=1784719 RepID=UPI00197EB7CB|nr:hypothetical protein [Leucobacter triazinivorans]
MPSHTGDDRAAHRSSSVALIVQSTAFMIGAALFAVGAAASIWDPGSARLTNALCFIGAWFFTAAGLMQLAASGPVRARSAVGARPRVRAEWAAAATQSLGTILFNVSTSAALTAATVSADDRLVWRPDAGGSAAFLISAALTSVAYARERGTAWEPSRPAWWAALLNAIGCVAFAGSAVGAYVLADGAPENAALANWGTFIGAIAFFAAAALALPQHAKSPAANATGLGAEDGGFEPPRA